MNDKNPCNNMSTALQLCTYVRLMIKGKGSEEVNHIDYLCFIQQ